MSTPLTDFLLAAGYRRVALTRNGVGHFETAGTLNGHKVRVLVDTGAGATVVELAVARALGLEFEDEVGQGGGAGGAGLDAYLARGAELRLGEFVPRVRALVAMDLSHANAAMAAEGAEPVELILGVDVFDAHAAVIDYDSDSLFLKEP